MNNNLKFDTPKFEDHFYDKKNDFGMRFSSLVCSVNVNLILIVCMFNNDFKYVRRQIEK